ncbi:hypothetical protein DXU07_23290 [Bradyrhizobium elkanii]|nr:hypothetical protein A6X20_18360 [Bradyrhizobium elkanii]QOZ20239.1 hypothetical protein XI02_38410 [Bradyrhizobium sp. CCBAU 21365]BBB96929.1 hypothetical protein BE61_23610 [Bradyrhizobium elkanii USDA 61]ODM85491.1 hypothetical protein A6452_12930 [Bradyrhizobium elkanii]OIM88020.1 hypothetical protein BLN97_45710 [Bradyrhizobium elkanii]
MLETLAEQLRRTLLASKGTKVRRREIELVSDLVDLPGGQQIELVSTRKKCPQAGQKTLELR